jgi:hypothetical protein
VLNAEQLDQLLAPIALYPDALLAQILMAATYPLEIVKSGSLAARSQSRALTAEPLRQQRLAFGAFNCRVAERQA